LAKIKIMKQALILLTVLSFGACNTSTDRKSDEAAITKLLDDETHFAAKGDSLGWASCWVNSDEASFILTDADGVQTYSDFNSLANMLSEYEPFELKLARSNYEYVTGDNVAFVSFDQEDNWGGADRKTKETRTLRKVNGNWKIVHAGIVVASSFPSGQGESFHMAANKIPPNPKNGFTNVSGLGGMSIGYLDVPGPTDFTPLFAGLPDDMCSSPHWGYVIDGSLRIKYPGGKEETVSAGEVFYWPAPHTGVVDKSVKFVDFSPDHEFIPVMAHLAKKMAEAAPKN
jgi:hypothetical protein